MSLRGVVKLLRSFGLSAFFLLAAPALSWAQQACATGACAGATFGTPCAAGCGTACQTTHCPPAYQHCYEGPPHIHWRCGCPHPIANPCDLPHWGYYDKCWTPWPFPPNWTHCPTPPPAAFVALNPLGNLNMPTPPAQQQRVAPNPANPQNFAPAPPFSGNSDLPAPQRYDATRPPF